MKPMAGVIGAVILLTLPYFLFAQEGIGQNPSTIKWRQIQTPTGKLIYPEGMDSVATKTAFLLQLMNQHDTSVLGSKRMKNIPVIIQNQSIFPAGFATPAPWRSELHVTPPQNQFLGAVPWLNALTVHEYRHAQQFAAANRGFTRFYQVLLGETGWLINTLATQPLWFREGDAVLMESVATDAGRGRLPSFNAEYRALRLEGYDFSYDKGTWLSFKDYVPNPYRIGYYMTTFARRKYGAEVWEDILKDTYTKKFPVYPFIQSVKKHTGLTPRQLYHETLQELDSIFKATDGALALTPSVQVTEEPKAFTSYRYPHYINDSTLIAEKSGFEDISSIVSIDRSGNETKLLNYGIYTTDHKTFNYAENTAIWAVADYDERWGNKSYSNIVTFNTETKKLSKLTSYKRYFSPALSYDGKKVAVVEITSQLKQQILILDAQTGKLLKALANPESLLYTQLHWTEDDKKILAVAIDDRGNSIQRINAETGASTSLIDYTNNILERPFEKNGYVYFSAGFGSISNIYARSLTDTTIYQVTSTRFGAYDPVISPDGSKIAYSEYTALGYKISEALLDRSKWTEIQRPLENDILFHEPLVAQEGAVTSMEAAQDTFTSKPYHPALQGLFNIYGWIPLPNIPEYGLELYTRNIMSTTIGTYGIAYHTQEDVLRTYGRFTYAFFYPVLELSASSGERRANTLSYTDNNSIKSEEAVWRENSYSAGLHIPLHQTHKAHMIRADIGGAFKYYGIHRLNVTGFPNRNNFNTIEGNFEFSRLIETARRHVNPRWGQTLDIQVQKSIGRNSYEPERYMAQGSLFFPGLVKTHSFNLEGAVQRQKVVNSYVLQSIILPARGYRLIPNENFYKASFNYEMPLFYPDLAVGPVAFFQRVRSNFFYDYSAAALQHKVTPLETYTSVGTELIVDLRLFRLFQMALGLQYSYKLDEPDPADRHFFTVIVPRFKLLN